MLEELHVKISIHVYQEFKMKFCVLQSRHEFLNSFVSEYLNTNESKNPIEYIEEIIASSNACLMQADKVLSCELDTKSYDTTQDLSYRIQVQYKVLLVYGRTKSHFRSSTVINFPFHVISLFHTYR